VENFGFYKIYGENAAIAQIKSRTRWLKIVNLRLERKGRPSVPAEITDELARLGAGMPPWTRRRFAISGRRA
jgi:hypothetical protein